MIHPALIAREAPKSREEIWQAIRFHNESINLATQIPYFPQYYTWRVTGSVGGKVLHEKNVPIYIFDQWAQELVEVGSISVGTEISLTRFNKFGRSNFFQVPADIVESKRAAEADFWINGQFIERDEGNSFKPPKDFIRSPLLMRARAKGKK